MVVNTKKVSGRRSVKYSSYQEMLSDAERLAGQPVEMLGNWTQAQNYKHIAMAIDSSIDGTGFKLPLPLRWLMSVIMKNKFLTKAIPAGFKTTDEFCPSGDVALSDALADLKKSVERQKSDEPRAVHPAFGNIGRDEWDQFNLRHAEMHMSFIVPNKS